MYRDNKGQFKKTPFSVKALGVFLVIVVLGLGSAIVVDNAQQARYVAPEVDNRDSIQKVVDAFAVSYRDMQQAQKEYDQALEKLNKATEAYNMKARQLETYTN